MACSVGAHTELRRHALPVLLGGPWPGHPPCHSHGCPLIYLPGWCSCPGWRSCATGRFCRQGQAPWQLPSPPALPRLYKAEQHPQHPQPGIGDVPQRTHAPGSSCMTLPSHSVTSPSRAGAEPPMPLAATPALWLPILTTSPAAGARTWPGPVALQHWVVTGRCPSPGGVSLIAAPPSSTAPLPAPLGARPGTSIWGWGILPAQVLSGNKIDGLHLWVLRGAPSSALLRVWLSTS